MEAGVGGAPAWHREFEDPDFPNDSGFRAVGVDSQNRIYAAGGKYYSAQTANLLMVRYSPAGSAQAMWRSDGQQSGYCSFTEPARARATRRCSPPGRSPATAPTRGRTGPGRRLP